MTSIPTIGNAALLILQRSASSGDEAGARDMTVTMAAAENGLSADALSGMETNDDRIRAEVTEKMFSVSHVSVQEKKIDLIERTGKALGIDKSDYASDAEFSRAMRDVFENLKTQANGWQFIREIERDLGLDELGVSLEDVIDAASDPDGKSGDRLEAALGRRYGADEEDEEKDGTTQLSIRLDDIGRYGILSA